MAILVLPLTGEAGTMIDRGDNTYGGKYVINPSGGLISKGHPLGATGVNIRFFSVCDVRNFTHVYICMYILIVANIRTYI